MAVLTRRQSKAGAHAKPSFGEAMSVADFCKSRLGDVDNTIGDIGGSDRTAVREFRFPGDATGP